MPPTQNDQKGHHYSQLPQSELDQAQTRPAHEDDQGQPSSKSSTSTDCDSSDNETGNFQNGEHDVRLTLLPESSQPDQSHSSEDRQHIPLSISMEYPGPTTAYYYFDETQNDVSADGNKEASQDLLGLTVLIMLILSPLYKRMESPTGDPVPPLFTLNSMYVSNFAAVNGTLSATWDAKLEVENANVSSIYFRHMEIMIFYNDSQEYVLSGVLVKPFFLEEGEVVKLHVKFTTRSGAWEGSGQRVESWVAEEIGREREREGAVKFGMKMKVEAMYYVGTWVGDVEMSPHCEGLRVQFLVNQGSGRLTLPHRNFSVPIVWKPFSFF